MIPREQCLWAWLECVVRKSAPFHPRNLAGRFNRDDFVAVLPFIFLALCSFSACLY